MPQAARAMDRQPGRADTENSGPPGRAAGAAELPGSNELSLLIVDDDQLQARLISSNLQRPGRIRTATARSAEEALERLAREPFDAVLTDVMMPGVSGIELVRRIRASDASLPVILMTANATLEGAVEGVQAGATDFLPKPVNLDAVLTLVRRAVAERPMRDAVTALQRQRAETAAGNLVFGSHPRLEEVRDFARQLAAAPQARVLITGESGTGKSLLARLIHDLSGEPGRFVEINCAALPPQLLESELFGHEAGAFTDAKSLKRGLIEQADKGTLLLDEIGSMPIELQAKLLLFLESREFRRVGGVHAIPVRTRVVAATNQDLRRLVRDREFRADLLYRLDVAAVEMPPLRQIPAVIPELARRFVVQLAAELHKPVPETGEQSFALLASHRWPGNARELRNAVERALIFHRTGGLIVQPPPEPLAALPADVALSLPAGLSLREVERQYIEASLDCHDGDLAGLAATLGISRKTLWDKRRRYDL